jgi:hypothetical protein
MDGSTHITIRRLHRDDVGAITSVFTSTGWNKPASQYHRYLEEQEAGSRAVLLAFTDEAFAGYLTIKWYSDYVPFHEAGVPEIQT